MSELSFLNRVGAAPVGRREFLRGGLRHAAAVGVVVVTAFAARRGVGSDCVRPLVCGECPVYGGCDLEKAEEHRRVVGKGATTP